MQFGEIKSIEGDENKSIETTTKVHNGEVSSHKQEFKERVQVLRATDLDTIIEEMHIKHALDFAHGAWLEKYDNGKMYVVKYYAKLDQPVKNR